MHTSKNDRRFALVDELLPDTVRRAVSDVVFYRHHYSDVAVGNISRDSLQTLPSVDKATLRRSGSDAFSNVVKPYIFQNTSGSTGGFQLTFKSAEEIRFIGDFYSNISTEDNIELGVSLSLGLPTHGSPTPIPFFGTVLTHCIVDERSANNVLGYLGSLIPTSKGNRRVDSVVGAVTQVLLLARYVLEKRFELPPLKRVVVTGDYISKRSLDMLRSVFCCAVFLRYSLSEVFGGAVLVGDSDYVFDPNVFPEILSLEGDRRVPVGELALTSLFPFVQAQPMIRYRTGDIFAQTNVGLAYCGRRRHCLFDDGGSMLISGVWLLELMDECPVVARQSYSLGLSCGDDTVAGKPIIFGRFQKLDACEYDIQLRVCTSVDLNWHPKYKSALIEQWREQINGALSNLNAKISIETTYIPRSSALSAYEKGGTIWASSE